MAPQEEKIRILIVDDEKSIRTTLKYWLRISRLFIIEEASNGEEALEKVKAVKPDVILLDATLPVMDGLQTYKKLKENPRTRSIPVIFTTARPYSDIIRQIPITPDEYIEKPYELKNLQIQLDRIIKNYCITP